MLILIHCYTLDTTSLLHPFTIHNVYIAYRQRNVNSVGIIIIYHWLILKLTIY